MSSYIYVYLNEEDLALIELLLHQEGVSFFDEDGNEVTKLLAFSALSKQYQIGADKSGLIYSPCNTSLRIIQPAFFYLPDICSKTERTLFNKIKMFIRHNFMQCQWYYYGQYIYRDWLDYKYHLPWFESQRVQIKKDLIEQVWKYIEKNHYFIRNNKVDIEQKETVNLQGFYFIVFCEKARLFSEIVDINYDIYKKKVNGSPVFEHREKQIVEYSEQSDCVFLSKEKRCYCLSIDQRKIYAGDDATCVAVFHSIKQFLVEKQQEL